MVLFQIQSFLVFCAARPAYKQQMNMTNWRVMELEYVYEEACDVRAPLKVSCSGSGVVCIRQDDGRRRQGDGMGCVMTNEGQ